MDLPSSARILIADDDQVFLESLADLLRHTGYACDTAPDGSTAIQMLAENDYELLIADIQMPGNTRFELVNSIPPRHQGLPVIIVTGHPSVESAVVLFRLPVFAYLTKPLNIPELLTQAESAVRRYHVYRTIIDTRRAMHHWLTNMDNLTALIEASHTENASMAAKTFIATSLRNIFGAVANISRLIEAMPSRDKDADASEDFKSPRTVCLEAGLQEAVRTLEATKRSFKSKEIADLRKKLEGLLQSQTA
ncbi:MAG TPA: response regulator [bacterium]